MENDKLVYKVYIWGLFEIIVGTETGNFHKTGLLLISIYVDRP